MNSQSEPGGMRQNVTDSSEARRRALRRSVSAGRSTATGTSRVRADERRRYVFQVWTNAAFAAVWLLVFVLSGSWLFVALAVGFGVLAALAGWCLVVVRRQANVGDESSDASSS